MNIEEFSIFLGVSNGTIYNWKKNKPNLYKVVMEWKEKNNDRIINGNNNIITNGTNYGSIHINNSNEMNDEIYNEIKKLDDKKREYFYHLIKIENLKD